MKTKLFSQSMSCKGTKVVIVFLLLFQWSCVPSVNDKENSEAKLNDYLTKEFAIEVEEGSKYVFFYLDGCSSCLDLYKQFMITHYEDKSIHFFLITKSEKKARSIYDPLLQQQVYIDKESTALFEYDLVKDIPMVYVNLNDGFEEMEIALEDLGTTFL